MNFSDITLRKHYFFIALMLSLFAVPGCLFAESCPGGAVSYWKLDESSAFTYADSIGSHEGACASVCPSASSDGAISGAQLFDGSQQSGINIPANAAFDWSATTSFSIEMWVKRTSASVNADGEVLIGRKDQGSSMEWSVEIREASNGDHVAAFKLVDANGTGAGENLVAEATSKAITTGVWHHIVAVRDATNNTNMLFVDGKMEAQQQNLTYSAGFGSATDGLNIGWFNGGTNRALNGTMDEIAVYNRVLTDREIKSHYYLSRGYCTEMDDPIRVTPMGDSITKDREGPNDTRPDARRHGYRRSLHDELLTGNFDFDFIGSEGDKRDGLDPPDFTDVDHTGWGAIQTKDIKDLLPDCSFPSPDAGVGQIDLGCEGTYLEKYQTDIILLHIGTNDVTVHFKHNMLPNFPNESMTNLDEILDEIDAYDEQVTVLLAKVINRVYVYDPNDIDPPAEEYTSGDHATTNEYNDALVELANRRIAAGDKIIVVDMESEAGLVYELNPTGKEEPFTRDFKDDVHPSPLGYKKMGAYWSQILNTFLPGGYQPPIITSEPATTAAKDQLYTYQVETSGSGPLQYTLLENPEGMTISDSGLIEWTPTAEGVYGVTVRVSNQEPGGQTRNYQQQHDITVTSNQPTAKDDSYDLDEGDTLKVGPDKGLLNNDDGASTAYLVDKPDNGELTLNVDGSFTYIHDGSELSSDTFTYANSQGQSDPINVTLTINPINDPPRIEKQVKKLSTKNGAPVKIQLEDLEVTDPDSDYPDDFSLTIGDSVNYTIDEYSITPNKEYKGETLLVPVTVSDGKDTSDTYYMTLDVSRGGTTGDGDTSSGSSGGCFIESAFISQGYGHSGHNAWTSSLLAALGVLVCCLPSAVRIWNSD